MKPTDSIKHLARAARARAAVEAALANKLDAIVRENERPPGPAPKWHRLKYRDVPA